MTSCEYEVELYDENGVEYTLLLDVEYDATPEEYEGGYYFAGGVEYCGAKILSITWYDAVPNIKYKVGDSYELDDDHIGRFCRSVRDDIVYNNGGRYPRENYSPDW